MRSPAGTSAAAAPSVAALERSRAHNPAQPRLWQRALAMIARTPDADREVGAAYSIGGERPLRMAVVTAYAREDLAMLRRCDESVRDQTYPCRHFMVADNTYRPRHVESLVCRQQATGAAVCYSGRTLHLADGQLVPGLLADDSAGHVDTNCVFFARAAFSLLSAWTAYPRALSIVGDSIVMQMLRARGWGSRSRISCTGTSPRGIDVR